MLHFLRLAAIANAALLMVAAAAEKHPNVIVISGDFGAEGKRKQLEKWHQGDLTVRDSFASPVPTATLASWLTGCHEFKAGITHVRGGRNFIRPEVPLVSDAFRSAGYRTAFIGEWGLGNALPFRPEDRGFQDVRISGQGTPGDHWGPGTWLRTTTGWQEAAEPLPDALHHAAAKWLSERATDHAPFFLHLNLPVGSESLDVLEDLALLPIPEETIIMILGTVGRPTADEPDPIAPWAIGFQAGAADGAVPRLSGGGSGYIREIAACDGMPTLANLCNIPLFRDWQGDGLALAAMRGTDIPRTFFFHPGGWSSVQSVDHYKSDGFVVRTSRWRLSGLELLDMGQPATARHDVFEEQPDVTTRLLAAYGKWWLSIRTAINEPARVIVGDLRQSVVPLTWADWWPSREFPAAEGPDSIPDQTALRDLLARLADPARAPAVPAFSGLWKLHANREGNYRVTMSKVPPEAPKEDRDRFGKLKAGTVHVRSGKYESKSTLLEGATQVTLSVDLKEGPVDLETWFDDQTGEKKLLGAFFATLERIGDRKMPDSAPYAKPVEKK